MRRSVTLALLLFLGAALVPAAQAAVTVREPAYGIPHVFGTTDTDLMFE
jgi:acyl-homoserine lactone acylase PvdQ